MKAIYIILIFIFVFAAHASNSSTADMCGYAKLQFTPPQGAYVDIGACSIVCPGDCRVGVELSLPIWINGSQTNIGLIYPCDLNDTSGSSEVVRSLQEQFHPDLKAAILDGRAKYLTDEEPLFIQGRQAVWGRWKYFDDSNRTFAAYPPSKSCVAFLLFDGRLADAVQQELLGGLNITVNDAISPLDCGAERPLYSPDTQESTSVKWERINTSLEGMRPPPERTLERLEKSLENMSFSQEEALDRLGSAMEMLGEGILDQNFPHLSI